MAVDELNGKRCPGEAVCRKGEEPLHLLGKPSAGEKDAATGENSAAMICPQCPLFRTKPGREAPHITLAVNFAMEHEEEVNAGLRIANRDDLSPIQWAAIRGLARGRAKTEEYREAVRQEQTPDT